MTTSPGVSGDLSPTSSGSASRIQLVHAVIVDEEAERLMQKPLAAATAIQITWIAKCPPHQHGRAIAYVAADHRVRQRGLAEVLQHRVDRVAQIE